MDWLLKKLGYSDREYQGHDFVVRMEFVGREEISIIHTRHGNRLNMDAQPSGVVRIRSAETRRPIVVGAFSKPVSAAGANSG